MKKITYLLMLFLTALPAFAQGEANNWLFGQFAGIRFLNNGSVVVLPGSAINTNEGCSSISDANGNLLFYTDGRNVWDRNHVLMPNGNYNMGTGLMGDPSSTHSGIIVPKSDDPNIYYIFTVDEPHHQNAAVFPDNFEGTYVEPGGATFFIPEADDGFNNGLNYSIVDLSVVGTNGSIGDVVDRNQHLLTYDPTNNDEAKYRCSEKITAVKNADGTGFWVIAHFLDKFYAFLVDEAGVDETPVISQLTPFVNTLGYRRNAIGAIKASPDGSMLAIAHMQRGTVEGEMEPNGTVYLYDFDNATGILSNPLQISNNVFPYGIEFSPQSKKLYVAYELNAGFGGVHQYDLESGNIPTSDVFIANGGGTALQLGPNGKIYKAILGSGFLDVIENPEEDGLLCNYIVSGQPLGTGICSFGLPPFITSLFSAAIEVADTCLGQATQFQLNVTGTFDSVEWDFGDGSPTSSETNPTHTYMAIGNYTVVAAITRGDVITEIDRNISIHAIPVANPAPNLTECDPNNDGVATFNLQANTAAIRGGQSSTQFIVRYFASQANADANVQALNATAHINTQNPQTIFARIQNAQNADCYDTISFQINVSNTPTLNNDTFALCDDPADGDDANGQVEFDLDAVTAALVQNTAQFSTAYYASEADAEAETGELPQIFYNTEPDEQVIFARIVNNTFAECFAILPITLVVNPWPAPVPAAKLIQCDLGPAPDGSTTFNLAEADSLLTGGSTTMEVIYYLTAGDAENDINPLNPAYTNVTNPEQVMARVTNTQTGCFRIMPLELEVNTNTIGPVTLETCDDDGTEDGLTEFNLLLAGLEDGTNTVVYYTTVNDALLEQNAIGPLFTNTTAQQQSIYARIENNNDCTAVQEIILIARPLPDLDTEGEGIVCLNTGNFIPLDAGVNGSSNGFTYQWSTGAVTSIIMVNQPGVYTVTVTNTHGCEKVRTITVVPSDVAIIEHIEIKDLRDNNTVTVFVSPSNNVETTYLYSLDMPNGPFQESNYFENVPAGIHTVYVYDEHGCGIVSEEIAVLYIPNFFSPNGDGFNDTWNVIGINSLFYRNSTIYVFDRYGKFLSNVDPKGPGWDGTYNGARLPATDYWYVVTLDNGRTVKGHFSMIR